MKKYDIENIPVLENGNNIGAISEGGLFDKILNNLDIKTSQNRWFGIGKPYPEVRLLKPRQSV